MSESPDTRSLVSASSQLNLMEIDTIDDKEFDIPQVDTPPTLESILNEPEDEEEPFILEDTCLLNTENIAPPVRPPHWPAPTAGPHTSN
ncbi:vacuolar protein sorting-associated protein 8 homolog, partial [Oncorhynchus keta]|uniref:vacuolar protein sorting-associated protein 8 homolog n=1 Tax=Oncorhynchus keta TaxID=8018 RepID=UPI00227D26BA